MDVENHVSVITAKAASNSSIQFINESILGQRDLALVFISVKSKSFPDFSSKVSSISLKLSKAKLPRFWESPSDLS